MISPACIAWDKNWSTGRGAFLSDCLSWSPVRLRVVTAQIEVVKNRLFSPRHGPSVDQPRPTTPCPWRGSPRPLRPQMISAQSAVATGDERVKRQPVGSVRRTVNVAILRDVVGLV